jgi:hypothetical protein
VSVLKAQPAAWRQAEHMLAASARSEGPFSGAEIVAALQRRFEARRVESHVIETHISWVLVAGACAYKIKKPVRFGFLDFSTLDAQHHFCKEEVRLNRRLVPALYIGVVPVHAAATGPALGAHGPVIEYAVKMHRLPPLSLASERLARGALDAGQLARLAWRLAAFHRAAPVADAGSSFGRAERVRGDAVRALDGLEPLVGRQACSPLRAWLQSQAGALAGRWEQRLAAGRVREGHGDLHLDNVLVQEPDVSAFDCIEFDPALRWIDVMNDIAYLVMDLLAHGRRDLAFAFLDAYLEASGDHDGLDVLRFYQVYRAVVRALVTALRERGHVAGDGLHAADYLRLAGQLAEPGRARLLITHGLPGAGKTHVTQQLLERAGAIRLRSDVERKRMAGLAASASSRASGDLYTRSATEATYGRLAELARTTLTAGYPTIVDAAFLRRPQRDALRGLAAELQVPFSILDCNAPLPLLRERVLARQAHGGDASEADVAVLERLAACEEPLATDERACTIEVRTDQPLAMATLLRRWLSQGAPSPATGGASDLARHGRFSTLHP